MMAARSNLPTLSLHDALPIWSYRVKRAGGSRCETDPRHRRPRRPACDGGAELVRRALQRLFRERVEPFQQEVGIPGVRAQSCTQSLPPVPAPAGHSLIVRPDDLAGRDRIAVACIEGFAIVR